jgi:predicted DNA-binding transcriptional regulator AlpA
MLSDVLAVLVSTWRAIIRETALSRSSIYAAIGEGQLPAPRRMGARSVAWRLEDTEAWKNYASAIGKDQGGGPAGGS